LAGSAITASNFRLCDAGDGGSGKRNRMQSADQPKQLVAFANRLVTGGPPPMRYNQIGYANRAPTIDGSGHHRSDHGKLGDAYWTRKLLKNMGFEAEFRSNMVDPFLFIGGKLTGWSHVHPRNKFDISDQGIF
jgi:hypothetical protein